MSREPSGHDSPHRRSSGATPDLCAQPRGTQSLAPVRRSLNHGISNCVLHSPSPWLVRTFCGCLATNSVNFWGSAAADKDGSRNTIGIKNPAVDKLIDDIVFAKDRPELVAATHALDRVLLWNYYVVPHWYYPYERVAYWDIFGRPAKLPSQTSAPTQVWWIRRRKGKRLSRRQRQNNPVPELCPNANDHDAEMIRSRRAGGCCSLSCRPRIANAEPRHGLSVFGELKYSPDFQHFDYVNPDAPKGGRMVTMGTGGANTFDTLNQYILKGDAAQGLDFLFDSLMVRAQDEPDAVYGLIAKSADVAPDGLSVTFKLRPEAKFADGTPLTAADVVYSFTALKEKGHPAISMTLHDVVSAEALDPETVRYTFKGTLDARSPDYRRATAGAVQSLLFKAAVRGDVTEAAARIGSLQDQGFQARNLHYLHAPRRLLGERPPRKPWPL